MNNNILLFSGGLDSYVAYFYLNKPTCLYIDIKHKYAKIEKETIHKLEEFMDQPVSIEDNILNLSKWEREDAIIPLRNIYMSMIATNYGDNIWLAGVEGDYTHDKNPIAFKKMSEFLSHSCERKIKVDSPFWKMTKTDHVKWYIDNGYSKKNLINTYSCFKNGEIHCGHCPSCFRRWIAFYNNDIVEKYENNPLDWEMIPSYIEKMKNGVYSRKRAEEFFNALFKADYKIEDTKTEWIEKLRR